MLPVLVASRKHRRRLNPIAFRSTLQAFVQPCQDASAIHVRRVSSRATLPRDVLAKEVYMDRRNFLRAGIGAGIMARASAVPIEKSPDRERCFAWLTETECRSSEAMAMFHRPWRWGGLTTKIEETLVTTTRAWLLWRGLDATGERAHCIYEASRRPDDVTGVPWNEARVALLELRSLQVDHTPYGWLVPRPDALEPAWAPAQGAGRRYARQRSVRGSGPHGVRARGRAGRPIGSGRRALADDAFRFHGGWQSRRLG